MSNFDPQTILAFLKSLLVLVWSLAGVKFIIGNVLVNVVVALAAAQATKSVDLSKLAEFLTRKLLPYVVVYFIAKVFGDAAGLGWLSAAVFAVIEITLIKNLTENLALLGVPMPEALRMRSP